METPVATDPTTGFPKGFGRDLLIASAIFALFFVGAHQNALLKNQVCGFTAPTATRLEQIQNPSEQLFQMEPALFMTAKAIHQKLFPYWTPTVQAGTPLLGKMMNGTFSPYHLLNYIAPLRFFPYMLFLKILLQGYFSFAFTFLFARLLRLGFWGSVFGAILYAFCPVQMVQGLFSTFASGTYLALLLLLVEMYIRGYKRFFFGLTPWVIALMFFGGHLEAAVRFQLVAGVYYLARARQEKWTLAQAARATFWAAMPVALGWLIAGPQILAGSEYVKESYNAVWRGLAQFGWQFRTITKHYASDDLPLLVLGWICAIGGGVLLHQLRRRTRESLWNAGTGIRALFTVALFAVGLACLRNVGLDGFTPRYADYGNSWHEWAFEFALLALAGWTIDHAEAPHGVRALGWVLGFSAILFLKVPPFSNVLASLPVFKQFHNSIYLFEYYFAAGLLGGWALEQIWRETASPARSRAWLRLPFFVAIAWGAVLLSAPLQSLFLRSLGTGVPPENPLGAFMGRENYRTMADRVTLAGWVRAQPAPARIDLALAEGTNLTVNSPATWTRNENGRVTFSAELPLKIGKVQGVAIIQYPGGQKEILRGPKISRDWGPPLWTIVVGMLLIGVMIVVGGKSFPILALVGAAAFLFSGFPLWSSVPGGDIPPELPGIQKLREDPDLFRITNPEFSTFFNADSFSLYGMSDIRGGGDNLDLRSMMLFNQYAATLYLTATPAGRQIGQGLLGLANVKYFIRPSGSGVDALKLAPVYQGEDFTLYQNPAFMPRAMLYPDAVYLPAPLDLLKWSQGGEVFNRLSQWMSGPRFQLQGTLLVNDPLPVEPPPSDKPATMESVRIEEQSAQHTRIQVQTRRSAYLFVSDSYFPTWRATINGRPAPILRSWITFRAVRVPAGTSVVEFFVRPVKLWIATGFSALLGFALLLLHWKKRSLYMILPILPAMDKKPLLKKETKSKLPVLEDELPLTQACAASAERLLMAQVYAAALFWLAWSLIRLI